MPVPEALHKEPAARPVNVQKVLLELKLVTLAARCAEALAAGRREKAAGVLRAEVEQLETRVMRRLEEHEKSVAEIQQAANDALNALRAGFVSLEAKLRASQQSTEAHAARPAVLEHSTAKS